MSRRRKFWFAIAAMPIGVVFATAILLAADLYMHSRAERSAGLNRWGYRGPVVPRLAANEVRVAMVGGSTVFGYGGPWHESAPALLERELRRAHPGAVINVINLGYNNEGAFAALPTLEDYRYLEYNIAVLYEGYNDTIGDGGTNTQVYRRESVVYRLTGYSPILPLWIREKSRMLRSGGSPDGKRVFSPGLATRTQAAAMETATAVGEIVGRQIDRLAPPPADLPSAGSDCATPWSHYCASILRAIDYARSHGAKALVVGQPLSVEPALRAQEILRQSLLTAALGRRFGGDRGVAFLDLSDAIDLADRDLSFDGMHLGYDGNLKLAQSLMPAVERLAWPDAK